MKITQIHSGMLPLLHMLQLHDELEREHGPIPAIDSSKPSAPPADRLITLADAASLPDLGGVISIKMIRTAIARGDIKAVQPAGPRGAIYVTRSAVLNWIDRCPANQSHPVSTSAPRATATARSARMRLGSSSTAERKSALAAALKTAQALKQR